MALHRWVAALLVVVVLAGSAAAGEQVVTGCPPVPDEPLAALRGAGWYGECRAGRWHWIGP